MEDTGKADLGQAIRQTVEEIVDPAGRLLPTLPENRAMELAVSRQCSLGQIYMAALRLGICPQRYIRNQNSISIAEQLRLAESRVAVIGAGGLGGTVILLLARMGIGRLTVVDHDVFDETNLNRQFLSDPAVLGCSKAEEARDAVAAVNPAIAVSAHRLRAEATNLPGLLAEAQVVVDCLDNVPDRFVLERAAQTSSIPLVHGALAGFTGRVMTIFPGDPGLQLLYGGEQEIVKGDPARPEAVLGVPTPTPAVIASLQAVEVMKIILQRGRLLRNRMLHLDLESGVPEVFYFAAGAEAAADQADAMDRA